MPHLQHGGCPYSGDDVRRYPRHVILNEGQLERAVSYFSKFDEIEFDVETIGPHRGIPSQNDVLWIGMATHGAAVAIPMGHPIGDRIIGETKIPKIGKDGKTRNYKHPVWEEPPPQLRRSTVFEAIEPLLYSENRIKIARSLSFDGGSIAKYYGGRLIPPPYHCTLTSSWLLDENRLNGLKPRVKEEFGLDYDSESVGKKVEIYPFSKVALYSFLDSRYDWLSYLKQAPLLAEQGLSKVWQLEMDVLEVVLSITQTGAPFDKKWLENLRGEFSEELEKREGITYKAAGKIFNIGSAQQKAAILYGDKKDGGQGLKTKRLTDGGEKKRRARKPLTLLDYSTDAAALKDFPKNALAKAILDYQEFSTLLNTFVHGYLGDPEAGKPCIIFDDRVYTSLKPYGTVTGRFSSSNKNLQNIPIRTEYGAKIRAAFAAAPGSKLIVGDHGQIELVLLAHFAGPGALYDAFMNGDDPHTVTAARILGMPLQEVTPSQRTKYGKTINFLIGYGGGAKLLAEKADLKLSEAEQVIEEHRAQFPEIYRFKSLLLRTARSRTPPYVKTLTGRKRRIPELHSAITYIRSSAERQIINSLIQGSNGDLNKISMVRAHRMLAEHGIDDRARIILTVHDEIVIEAQESVAEQAAQILREAMVGPGMQELLTVPITADIKIVDRWAQAK